MMEGATAPKSPQIQRKIAARLLSLAWLLSALGAGGYKGVDPRPKVLPVSADRHTDGWMQGHPTTSGQPGATQHL